MSNAKKIKSKIDLINNLEKLFDRSDSKSFGEKVIKIIKQRSRSGKSLSGQKFTALSTEYVETRKKNKKRLHESTTPGKSNITATGQMLDSMSAGSEPGKIIVNGPQGKRSRELTGGRSKTDNRKIAQYVEEQGREFFGLTKEEKTRLISEVKKVLLRKLKSGLE